MPFIVNIMQKTKRDRSSFAGIAYEVIDEKNLVFGDIKEQLFKEVSTYEKNI